MGLSPWATEAVCNANKEETLGVKKQLAGLGQTFYEPTQEELKLWKALFPVAVEKWITEQEAKGRPAKALFQEALRLVDKYQ